MDNYFIRKNYKYFENIEQFSNDNLIKHIRLKFTKKKLSIIEIQLWIDSKNIFLDTKPEYNNTDYILNNNGPVNLVDEGKNFFSARESDYVHEIVFTPEETFTLNQIEALVIYHNRNENLNGLDLEFLDENKDIIYQAKEIIKDSEIASQKIYTNYILKGPSYDNHPISSQIIRRENSDIFNDSYISVANPNPNPKGSYFSYFNDIIPVEETPVEETPVEDTPVEDNPIEDTPVEETLVEETPVEEEPVEETPVEEIPVEETPVEETPIEETSEEIVEDESSEETLNTEIKEEVIKKDNKLMLISIAVIIVLFILFLLYFILK